ncbi:MAG: ATP-binding cassette domain-containing protein [Clostridia bacterium]|nr:ATP-binding cassette domain-containing protein [Clostridia bacterium]
MIEVKNLVKDYGGHLAVKNASFTIRDGEIVGFLGPNGAGKSTTMNILTGYLSATSGSVSVDGYDIVEYPHEAKKRIGYLPELPPLYTDMTVGEYLNFCYDLKKVTLPRKPHLEEICRLVRIDNVYKRQIKNLSKGYRQRVGIAQALIGNPDVLILDEPTVGLDPVQIIEIRNLIAQLGKNHTVILSSHILSEIQAVCERIIIINKGVIVADGMASELSHSLSQDHSLTARIEGPKAEVMKLIASIRGVDTVTATGAKDGKALEYRILPLDGVDIRKALFDRLADRHWPLIALSSNELTLEEIFVRLASDENTEFVLKMQEKKEAEQNEADADQTETEENN